MPELNHLVLLKAKEDVDPKELEGAFQALLSLRDEINGVLDMSVGPDVSVEGLAAGYTHGLLVRFADEQARERYLPHPAHQAAAQRLEPLVEGIAIVDIAADDG